MSAFKPGTRVVKVAIHGSGGDVIVPIGVVATVIGAAHVRNVRFGCDVGLKVDGMGRLDCWSQCWRPLDTNDPCGDSFADVLRKLDKVSA